MADVKLAVSTEVHNELQARIQGWEREKATLLKAGERIAELDALIAEAKAVSKPHSDVVEIARKKREDAEAAAAKAEEAKNKP